MFVCCDPTAHIFCQSPELRYDTTIHRLGTLVKMVFYAPDSIPQHVVWAGAIRELDRLNAVLSDYDSLSEVNRVNTYAYLDTITLSPELTEVLTISDRIYSLSGKCYDPALGHLTRLWRQGRQKNHQPDRFSIREARRKSGWQHAYFDSIHGRLFLRQAVRLDLGGLGKGYIGDKLGAYFRHSGINAFFIDLGGDLILGAAPLTTIGWSIGTELPGLPLLTLSGRAVMGSGSTYQYIQQGHKTYSHLLNPRRGLGVTHRRQSLVIAPGGAEADAWATALTILSKKNLKRIKPELLWAVFSSKKCIMSKYFYEYLQQHYPPWKPSIKLVII